MSSNMIATEIKNSLTSEFWNCLMLKKEEFILTIMDRSEVFDEPTLIWVILTMLEPSQNIGVQAEVKAVKNAKCLDIIMIPLSGWMQWNSNSIKSRRSLEK
eukprot:10440140-Ditylum_brightwellii.AAC.1